MYKGDFRLLISHYSLHLSDFIFSIVVDVLLVSIQHKSLSIYKRVVVMLPGFYTFEILVGGEKKRNKTFKEHVLHTAVSLKCFSLKEFVICIL